MSLKNLHNRIMSKQVSIKEKDVSSDSVIVMYNFEYTELLRKGGATQYSGPQGTSFVFEDETEIKFPEK